MTEDNETKYATTEVSRGITGTWRENADERIAAWQRLQYGMFIHWGPYSVYGGEYDGEAVTTGYSEQIQMWARIPETDYLKVAQQLGADQFDPDTICELAKAAGMSYIVMTSKHHDGFAMYDTATTDYNIVKQSTSGKDPLKMLADACARHGLRFGVYFSLVDWHLGHDFDPNNNNPIPDSINAVLQEQLRELMTHYGPIVEVWFDMSNPTDEQSTAFRDIVRRLQPEAAINSRIWNNTGDFRTLGDNQIPAYALDGAWQTPASVYRTTWGYRRWQERDGLADKVRHLVQSFVQVQARGGNYLLNIGPKGDGSVVPFEADVLKGVGSWIDAHRQAVIGAASTRFEPHAWGEITYNNGDLFLHVTDMPDDRTLVVDGLASEVRVVVEDGGSVPLDWHWDAGSHQLTITLPAELSDAVLPVIRVELDGGLCIMPSRAVLVPDDGAVTIGKEALYDGCSFADEGNYNTLVENTVRKTAFIASETGGDVTLTLQGEADPAKMYRVTVGDESQTITGERLCADRLGPFSTEADKVEEISITLARPTFAEEHLGLTLESIQVEKK